MIKIEVLYNRRRKSVDIYAGEEECTFEYLQNREIPSWFEAYSNDKFAWKGLLPELSNQLGMTVAEMEFDFQGDASSKAIFEEALAKNKGKTASPQEEAKQPNSQAKEEALENAKIYEEANKLEEAKEQFKIAADLGDVEACYHYGRLSSGTVAVSYYKKAAEKSNGLAMSALGDCYRIGTGTSKDENLALEWYARASEHNVPEANYRMGKGYQKGGILPQNPVFAQGHFQKAADSGHEFAQTELGLCYFKGSGVATDKVKAVEYWQKAVTQKIPKAQYFLGLCYLKGEGIDKNQEVALVLLEESAQTGFLMAQRKLGEVYLGGSSPEKGIFWFEKAAEQGSLDSKMELMKCYFSGLGVTQDYQKAIDLYANSSKEELRAEKYAESHFLMGECYFNGYAVLQDKVAAKEYYSISADLGFLPANTKLGEVYQKAQDGEKEKDINKSVAWYEKAAQQGDINAMLALGKLYKKREVEELGKKESFKLAYDWYLKAGELGNAEAQMILGLFWYEGWGVDKWSYDESAKWYEKAAKQGHAEAQYHLAKYFYEGHGVPEDEAVAFDWFMKAADQGHKGAQKEALWHIKKGRGTGNAPDKDGAAKQAEKWSNEEMSYDN
ncbi:MAG: tetratricopeptide repeat protein [Eubacteriales bacterium]